MEVQVGDAGRLVRADERCREILPWPLPAAGQYRASAAIELSNAKITKVSGDMIEPVPHLHCEDLSGMGSQHVRDGMREAQPGVEPGWMDSAPPIALTVPPPGHWAGGRDRTNVSALDRCALPLSYARKTHD
jgi:hypothetical protein